MHKEDFYYCDEPTIVEEQKSAFVNRYKACEIQIKCIENAWIIPWSKEYEDIQGFCKSATLEEVSAQDYILTPGRYVGIAEKEIDGEPFEEKMERLTAELSDLFEESITLQGKIKSKLSSLGFDM